MSDISKLVRIQIGVIATFIFIKFIVRPYILENDYPAAVNIFVLSYPNFCEAIAGTLSLVYIGLFIRQRWFPTQLKIKEGHIYIIATIVAAIYVILQEFKVHNLGGENVYDPYDVLFSVIGLISVYILLLFLKPRIE